MTTRLPIWCVVPVKAANCSKQRLSPVLTPDQRSTLARCMLRDVLDAVACERDLAGVALVMPDDGPADIGREFGARVLREPREGGMCGAVSHAARILEAEGAGGVLVLPADIPAVRPSDVDAMLALHRETQAVTLVEARRDGGTNAIVVSPPGAIAFRFGLRSAHAHREEARRRCVPAIDLVLPRVQLDIDEPEDLLAFQAIGERTRTGRYLRSIQYGEALHGCRVA